MKTSPTKELSAKARLIRSYLPGRVYKNLYYLENDQINRSVDLHGAILFFDLVRFTPLTKKIILDSEFGAEKLQNVLQSYFDAMVGIVHEYGGSIYQFAGDSAVASFEQLEGESDKQTAVRAASAAWKMKNLPFDPVIVAGEEFPLETKLSLSFGDYFQVFLGDKSINFNPAILGEPVVLAGKGEKHALPGDIIITNQYKTLLPDGTEFDTVDNLFKVTTFEPVDYTLTEDVPDENLDKVLRYAKKFIPPSLAEKLFSQLTSFNAEMRDISCVFVKFDGPSYTHTRNMISNINEVYTSLVKLSSLYGGYLIQTDFLDKGNVFLILFGAPAAVEQKENKAANFALKALKYAREKTDIKELKIGLASGKSYCGDTGASFCKRYSVLGDAVNLAARLMGKAENFQILTDHYSQEALSGEFELESEGTTNLKGLDREIDLFSLNGTKKKSGEQLRTDGKLIGRVKELSWLKDRFNKTEDQPVILSIEAEAGVGKTRLAQAFLAEVVNDQTAFFTGACYPYERYSSYYPWSFVFNTIFALEGKKTPIDVLRQIEQKLKPVEPFYEEWARVFSSICGYDIEEKQLTAALEPKEKNERIFQITSELLHHIAETRRLVIFLEDFHWADDVSNLLARYLVRELPKHTLVLLVTRPMIGSDSSLAKMEEEGILESLKLKELTPEEAQAFVQEKLALETPNSGLEKHILDKAYGNPFYIETIIYTLRDQGVLQKNGETYSFNGSPQDIHIPNSLQDIMLARVDRLKQEEQITLKTASIFGRLFQYELLSELSPASLRTSISGYVDNLASNDFFSLEQEDPITYIFKHMMIRDVIYSSILLSTRQKLHYKLGELIEEKWCDSKGDCTDLLAYHYGESDDKAKALEYTLHAAKKAFSKYSNKDAIHYATKALKFLKDKGSADNSAEVIDMKYLLARANASLAQYDTAKELYLDCLQKVKNVVQKARIMTDFGRMIQEQGDIHGAREKIEEALLILGKKAPKTKAGVYGGIVLRLILHELNQVLPVFLKKVKKGTKKYERLSARSETLFHLDTIYYFHDQDMLGWSNFYNILLADRLQDKDKIIMSYSNYAMVLVSLGLFGRATNALKIAEKMSKQTNNDMARAIYYARSGIKGMYLNEPSDQATRQKEGCRIFREINNLHELFLGLSAKSVGHFMMADYKGVIESYEEVQKKANQVGAKTFIAWAQVSLPVAYYFTGKYNVEQMVEETIKGVDMCRELNDIGAHATGIHYLCRGLIHAGDGERAFKYGAEIFEVLYGHSIFMPDTHIGYSNGFEAILTGIKAGKVLEPALEKKIVKGLKQLISWGKTFPYVYSPALRAYGQYLIYKGKPKGVDYLRKAVEVVDPQINPWEAVLAHIALATHDPSRKETSTTRAIEISQGVGLKVEVDYIQKNLT